MARQRITTIVNSPEPISRETLQPKKPDNVIMGALKTIFVDPFTKTYSGLAQSGEQAVNAVKDIGSTGYGLATGSVRLDPQGRFVTQGGQQLTSRTDNEKFRQGLKTGIEGELGLAALASPLSGGAGTLASNPVVAGGQKLLYGSAGAGKVARLANFARSAGLPGALSVASEDLNKATAGKLATAAGTSILTMGALKGAGKVLNKVAGKAAAKAVAATDDVGRIVEKANQVGKGGGPTQLQKNIYQGVLNISKKNNSFEKLKPNETVGKMIEYGVGGNLDDIATQTQKIAGKNGIVSNVVNESVGATTTPVDTTKLLSYLDDVDEGVFSALDKTKVIELKKRLITKIPSTVDGRVDASKLLDFERQLQEEATNHAIQGLKGDTVAKEFAQLKYGLADEMGKLIDSAVGRSSVDKFKDPRIVAELQKIGNGKIAKEYLKATTVSQLRALQKDFVRMSKIVDLAAQEPSGLGRNLFRAASQIPVVGPILDSAASNLAVPLATGTAIKMGGLNTAGTAVRKGAQALQGAVNTQIPKLGVTIGDVASRAAQIYSVKDKEKQSFDPEVLNTIAAPNNEPLTEEGKVLGASVIKQYGIPTEEEYEQNKPQTGQSGGFTITPEMVQEAYLTLPPDVADRIAKAYSASQGSADDEKRKYAAENSERIVSQLENLYFQGNKSKGKGRIGGAFAELMAATQFDPELVTYNAFRKAIAPTLARAGGDVGALSEPDQKRALELVPTAYHTEEEARQMFSNLRVRYGLPPKGGI